VRGASRCLIVRVQALDNKWSWREQGVFWNGSVGVVEDGLLYTQNSRSHLLEVELSLIYEASFGSKGGEF
jgi:hypothetical protein